MVRGTAEGVKDGYNNEGNSDYKESVLGGILPRLLSPKPLEGRQHGNTFDSEGTLGICVCEKSTGNNIPHWGREYKAGRSEALALFGLRRIRGRAILADASCTSARSGPTKGFLG